MNFKFGNIKISKISCSVPVNAINILNYASEIGISIEECSKIIKTSGIENINISEKKQTASDLCLASAKMILSKLNKKEIHEIDAILFVSQTQDYKIPQTSNILQDKLNLKTEIINFDLPIGCSGYVYGVFQACSLINAGCEKVLLLAGDTSSKMINNKDKTVSTLFGDAGSATVIEKGNDEIYFDLGSDGSGYDKLLIHDGGYRNLTTQDSFIEEKINDGIIRSKLDISMDGFAVMNFAIKRVPASINNLMEKYDISEEKIDLYALHQANKFMIDYIAKKMKIKSNKMFFNASNYGNTGPCSIPLFLSEFANNKNKLGKFILCGFGVGLSWATCYANLKNTLVYPILKVK